MEGVFRLKKQIDPDIIKKNFEKFGIKILIPGDPGYPVLLAEVADAPPLLYYRGRLDGGQEALAIVGARRATSYGKAAATQLAREVAGRGVAVVSGLARGIDTAAHQGALAAGGITWAFLGCGLDKVYPPENAKLADAIVEKGALISEFPPGSPPDARHFPARNRLISGAARGVVVVEAARKSGALITVDFALEQGREVFAVPGPIFSDMSRGTHHLLRLGARLVEDAEDIWSEINAWHQPEENRLARLAGGMTKNQNEEDNGSKGYPAAHSLVLAYLSDVPVHIDSITMAVPLPASAIALGLLELELAGKVVQLPGQHYVLAR